jgi:hypothetical protein
MLSKMSFPSQKFFFDVVLFHSDDVLTNAIYSLTGAIRLIDSESVCYKFSGYHLATIAYESCLSNRRMRIIVDEYARARWPDDLKRDEKIARLMAVGAKMRVVDCFIYTFEELWSSLTDPTGSEIRTPIKSLLNVIDGFQGITIMDSFAPLTNWLRTISQESFVRSHAQITHSRN